MGAVSDRADKFVSRILKSPAAPAVEESQRPKKQRAKSILTDLAKRRRRLLKWREGL